MKGSVMPETKRTYTISISRDPSISGYGGFDEWTIGPLNSQQADLLLERIEKAVSSCAKLFKVEGGWTGSN
jgi:predicted aminopeptidase